MNEIENDQLQEFGLLIDDSGKRSLAVSATWARFCGIFTIVALLLAIIFLVLLGMSLPGYFSTMAYALFSRTSAFWVIMGIIAIVLIYYGLSFFYLLRFSSKVKEGIRLHQNEAIFNGLKSMKVYLILMGVFSILNVLFLLYKLIA